MPATHTIRSRFVHHQRHRVAPLARRPSDRRRSPAASSVRRARAAGTGRRAGDSAPPSGPRRGRARTTRRAGRCPGAIARWSTAPSRRGFGRQRRSRPRELHLSWDRQRILEKVRSAAEPRPTGRRPAYLLRRVGRRCVPRVARSVDRAPSSDASTDSSAASTWPNETGRPPAASVIARQSDERGAAPAARPSERVDVELAHAICPGPRCGRTSRRRELVSHACPSTATPRAPAPPRRPARRRSPD